MSYTALYSIWGVLFALTAAAGFVPFSEGAVGCIMKILAVMFFVPGWLILFKAKREEDRRHRAIVRNLCLASLISTLLLLVLNLLSAGWPEAVGNGLHAALTVISAPMVCGNAYILSLFLWGCLLMGAISKNSPNTSPG